jgi:hypothetical protein
MNEDHIWYHFSPMKQAAETVMFSRNQTVTIYAHDTRNIGVRFFTPVPLIPERCNLVVYPTNHGSAQGSNGETVSKSNKAAGKRNSIANEVLAKKA